MSGLVWSKTCGESLHVPESGLSSQWKPSEKITTVSAFRGACAVGGKTENTSDFKLEFKYGCAL